MHWDPENDGEDPTENLGENDAMLMPRPTLVAITMMMVIMMIMVTMRMLVVRIGGEADGDGANDGQGSSAMIR